MDYGNYSEFCYVAPVASTTTTTTTSSSFDGLTEADLDFLKRMNMNDREVSCCCVMSRSLYECVTHAHVCTRVRHRMYSCACLGGHVMSV